MSIFLFSCVIMERKELYFKVDDFTQTGELQTLYFCDEMDKILLIKYT